MLQNSKLNKFNVLVNLLQVKNDNDDFGWGAVINFQKKANQSKVSLLCLVQ